MGERVTESGFYNGKFVKSGQGKPESEEDSKAAAAKEAAKPKPKSQG